jgi:hypothetical protein
LFKYNGVKDGRFVNFRDNNKVLDVKGGKDEEGNAVGVWSNNGGTHQKWRVLYLDKAGKLETKGLNEEFGFHINRPFYLVSQLPFNRVAEMHGNTNVWLKRWRNNVAQQQWWFDEKTKTVRNNYGPWKGYALEIQGNGGSNNLRAAGINSRWW